MIDHNHFICHFIFGGHLLNIPIFCDFLSYLVIRDKKTCHFRNLLFFILEILFSLTLAN